MPSTPALRVCEAFASSTPAHPLARPRAFVYVSAEDIFRPFISARYIESKREAEQGIARMLADDAHVRGVYVRPSECASHRPTNVEQLTIGC